MSTTINEWDAPTSHNHKCINMHYKVVIFTHIQLTQNYNYKCTQCAHYIYNSCLQWHSYIAKLVVIELQSKFQRLCSL